MKHGSERGDISNSRSSSKHKIKTEPKYEDEGGVVKVKKEKMKYICRS